MRGENIDFLPSLLIVKKAKLQGDLRDPAKPLSALNN